MTTDHESDEEKDSTDLLACDEKLLSADDDDNGYDKIKC